MKNVSVIKLEKEKNYAIIAPGQITYALNASEEELNNEIEEVYEETKKFKLEEPSKEYTSIAIIPTFDCNLRCIYCYANGGKTNEIISLDIVKKALNHVRNNNKKAKILDMFLVGGGEPLLHFDLVKEIVKTAEHLFDKVEIHVVTNGTFKEAVLKWLIERKANIRVSYDVLGQTNQRPFYNNEDSKEIVEKNIKSLLNSGLNVMIQCIVTSDTVNKLREIATILCELGVKVVKFEPCLMTDVSRGTKNLQPDPKIFANKLLDVIEYIAVNNLNLLVDTGYFTKPTIGKYCGMGNGNFTVTPEGMITPCVEVGRKSDPYANKLMIGEISDDVVIYDKNVEFLSNLSYNKQKGGCSNCEYRFICLGGCPMANIWQGGLPIKKSNFTCVVEHTLIPKLLSKIIENERIMQVVMENPTKY